MSSSPATLDTEFSRLFNNKSLLFPAAQPNTAQDCRQTGLKKLAPVFKAAGIIDPKPRIQVKPPAPTKLTGIEEDVAACKRVANAIDELLHETNTVEKIIAIGAEYAKLHDQLVRNSRFDASRLGWHQAFNQKIFKHSRRHAEYHIAIYRVLAGNTLPTSKLPHALRPLLLLARVLTKEKVTDAHLKMLLDKGLITPLTTEAEVKEVLGLKSKTKSSKSGATATSDIVQNIPVRELLQQLSPDQRKELIKLVVGEHAGSSAAINAAAEITAVLLKNRKVQHIVADAGFTAENFRVVFQVRLAAAA